MFSRDSEKSRRFGENIYLDSSRLYADYREMADKESGLPATQRIDFVSIATPNASHFDIARTFLEAGFHVICDKPITRTLAEAKELKSIVGKSGKVFALTYTYTGYPMVKQARNMVRQGLIGNVTKVVVYYPQGWLARFLEGEGAVPYIWRMDPDISGATCCVGDIGTHAENLVRYMTGLEIEELCADLSRFIPGNRLDDDCSILVHYKGGAKGIILVSQISTGEGNNISIRVYGTRRSLAWEHDNPESLVIKDIEGTKTVYSKGSTLYDEVGKIVRLPMGHPEGFIGAFSNIYLEAFKAIRAQMDNESPPVCDYPTVDDGVIDMSFIEAVIASAASEKKWTKVLP